VPCAVRVCMRETRLVSTASDPVSMTGSDTCASKWHSPAIHFLPTLHVNTSLNGLQVGPSDKTDIQSTALLKILKWTCCFCPPDQKARLRVLTKLVLFRKHTLLPPQQPPKPGPCQPPCRSRRQATEQPSTHSARLLPCASLVLQYTSSGLTSFFQLSQ
jgi:hypothetical protein